MTIGDGIAVAALGWAFVYLIVWRARMACAARLNAELTQQFAKMGNGTVIPLEKRRGGN